MGDYHHQRASHLILLLLVVVEPQAWNLYLSNHPFLYDSELRTRFKSN